jgi:ankyrin repeat protein/Zn-dependent protease
MVILVLVLLIHEIGHLIGMRLFQYRDVQMFFIPLFGAAVAGSETNPSGARRAIVTLLGPLPGIVLGVICAVLYFTNDQDIYLQAARTFLFINAFNLLPLPPLDGGRFLEEVVFSRNARAEVFFKLIAGLALVQVAFMLQSVLLGIFALFVLFLLPPSYRTSKMAQQFRRGISSDEYYPIDRVPRKYLERLVPLVADRFKLPRPTPKLIAGLALTVWRKTCHRPPKVAVTAGLVAVYFLSCTVGVVAPITLEMKVAASDVFQMVEQGDVDGLRSWLETGGDVNLADIDGQTALRLAAALGEREIVGLLLDSGADIEAKSVLRGTPLMAAVASGRADVLKALLDHGADPNAELRGSTALMMAALVGDADAVNVLLDHGSAPNTKDDLDGMTALMCAAEEGHTDVIRVLLDRGADVNSASPHGVSALMIAAVWGHTDVVRVLLERGADPAIRDEDGLTALMHAQEGGHSDIVPLLR